MSTDSSIRVFILLAALVVLSGSAVAVTGTASELPSVISSGVADVNHVTAGLFASGQAEPADVEFHVSNLTDAATLQAERTFVVSAELTNDGEREATRTVSVRFDRDGDGTVDAESASREVTLEGGETTTVEFSVSGDGFESGTYEYQVATESDEATATLDLQALQPPTFEVTSTSGPGAIVEGGSGAMEATITNRGDAAGGQVVRFAIDRDRDGVFEDAEQVATRSLNIDPGADARARVEMESNDLTAGTYTYRVATRADSGTGKFVVKEPAAFRVESVDAPTDVARGESIPVTAVVSNTGDVSGTGTVSLSLPESFVTELENQSGTAVATRSVTLGGGAQTFVRFTVDSAPVPAGNYTYDVAVDESSREGNVMVEDAAFTVRDLDAPRTRDVGESFVASATVVNTGNTNGTQTVSFRIDADDDSRPERVGLNTTVSLQAGENATVEFEVPTQRKDLRGLPEDLDAGSYVYGVYTDDDNATSVISMERDDTEASSGSTRDTTRETDTEPDRATLDEVTQAKYGMYFDELSPETHGQIREIYERQPFADGLALTEIRTREEVARKQFDIATGGHGFYLTDVDVETQQKIEAEYDAQFQTESGDSVESWEEIANAVYGTSFENLNETRTQEVKTRYLEQFDT